MCGACCGMILTFATKPMIERKQVTEYASVLRGIWTTEKIEDLIHTLKHLRSQGYSNVELLKEYEPYCSESTIVLKAIKYRKENNEEYNKRIEIENQQKEQRRFHYENLRKEFENDQSKTTRM